jgi:aquaporin Z
MSEPPTRAVTSETSRRLLLRSFGTPNSVLAEFDFWDKRYEARRLFAEAFGTFLLVLVAAGGGMVNARFGGAAVPYAALVVAPALMVMAIILFMGAVSGAHLNPAVTIAFAMRRDFPWRRVPAYVVAQLLGAVLAPLLLRALIGAHGTAGLTLPGAGIPTSTAMIWEIVLTTGLVSTVLGVSSGAQQLGPIAAIGVGQRRVVLESLPRTAEDCGEGVSHACGDRYRIRCQGPSAEVHGLQDPGQVVAVPRR